jgi:hypothetical protein
LNSFSSIERKKKVLYSTEEWQHHANKKSYLYIKAHDSRLHDICHTPDIKQAIQVKETQSQIHVNKALTSFRSFESSKKVLYSTEEWQDHANKKSYFYHYTSNVNAVSILRDKKIFARVGKRAHYGQGVFFTIHTPNEDDKELIENNYIYFTGNRSQYIEKVECAFAIERGEINAIKLRNCKNRDVWQHKNDIDLTRTTFKLISRKNKYLLDRYVI